MMFWTDCQLIYKKRFTIKEKAEEKRKNGSFFYFWKNLFILYSFIGKCLVCYDKMPEKNFEMYTLFQKENKVM